MKRHLITVSSLAVLGLLATATPATAGPSRYCGALIGDGFSVVQGAYGGGSENLVSRTFLDDVHLYVKDTRADGHHVRIRLMTRRNDGTTHFWPWRALYSGAGTSDSWSTTATDSGGIRLIQHQVAVYEGDTQLGSCVTEGYDG